MNYRKITLEDVEQLKVLQVAYKNAIGEEAPTNENLEQLKHAIDVEQIQFYGCFCEEELVACCSICITFSTFHYGKAGVFEDFYIRPEYRHQGIARHLVEYAYSESGVESLTVGCADCDVAMYQAIGFAIPLGNMLAYSE